MIFQRIILPLYLLTLLFMGLGYLAILPAFEGFDETAHYSSIRQIADMRTIPIYGASFLDQEAADYQGPSPYNSGMPPFDQGMTYSKFFAQSDLVEHYLSAYRQSSAPSLFLPSQAQNWQAQHPPLYYMLLAPLEKATESFSFVTRVFLLRLASFLIALGGVALGLLAIRQSGATLKTDPSIVGFMLYPLVLPMFFPEFTRIGNDSLCIFLVGAIAFLLSKWLKDENNNRLSLVLGVALGLGLLTKAFFIPIMVALGAFLLVRMFLDKRATMRSTHWKNLTLIFLPALLIGSGWYAYKFMAFGNLIGSADAIALANKGGLLANLKQNFSSYAVVRGLVVTFVSYSWAGTWSLTRLPALLQAPLLVLAVWSFGAFAQQLKRRPLTDIAWLPVWLFGMFGGGFLYHAIIGVALSGNGQTPGWYLHILMPWVAPALGIGLYPLLQNPRTKPFLIGLLIYAVLFQIMAIWSQFALFTGCATKGDDKSYTFSGHSFCLDKAHTLTERLSVLGWPVLAAVGFIGGLICVLSLVFVWRYTSDRSVRQPKAAIGRKSAA
jgi:hypothetical protein